MILGWEMLTKGSPAFTASTVRALVKSTPCLQVLIDFEYLKIHGINRSQYEEIRNAHVCHVCAPLWLFDAQMESAPEVYNQDSHC